ncbi:Alkanesulfonate monooxygenase [Heyndrickxia sporothermodurans]|uniref:Alkanesulfonate monooxygenase n=1 Tax=Heyndrickxia sporothermodurans TaxID=46224 RepID=A0A150LA23_9BACI|nr:LLM class flavin-dependent oxidoreductase [Heyndrickxia sporothermodurans]KYD08562.1 Alkanesulfonate monooxygenase [Heyndrickxia sporothermodurans]
MNLQYELYTNTLTIQEPKKSFIDLTIEHIKRAERYNYKGTLVPYGKNTFDPWIVSLIIAQNTKNFIPLVAVQPYSVPPQTTAKMIQTIEYLYKRKININYITGEENGDKLNHDEKYLRLNEYIEVVNSILLNNKPMTYHGTYYNFTNYDMKLPFSSNVFSNSRLPEIFIAGGSEMSIETAVKYGYRWATPPGPISIYENYINNDISSKNLKLAIGIGIIARPDANDAWEVARDLFPQSRIQSIQTIVHSKKSQSHWIKKMAELAAGQEVYDDVYWMGAYSRKFNPYLVGDYDQIASYLEKYLKLGVRTLIVAGPYTEEEFEHRNKVFLLLNSKLKSLQS